MQASVAPKGGRVVGWGGGGVAVSPLNLCFLAALNTPVKKAEGRRLATILCPEKTKTALYLATFMKSPPNVFLCSTVKI